MYQYMYYRPYHNNTTVVSSVLATPTVTSPPTDRPSSGKLYITTVV